jgi:hypothetical protein
MPPKTASKKPVPKRVQKAVSKLKKPQNETSDIDEAEPEQTKEQLQKMEVEVKHKLKPIDPESILNVPHKPQAKK